MQFREGTDMKQRWKQRWMQRSKQRSMGRVAGMAVAAAVAAVLTACGGGGGDGTTAPVVQPVATVSVTLASAQVAAGGATTASAELRNASGAVLTGRTIAWTSSNSAVASIDGAGNVTAISAGTTLISASSEGKSASATLTVIPAPVATVTVTLAQSTVPVGSATQATVTLRDTRGLVVTDRNVVWSSSNQAVATVNASGGVTTVAPGTVEIVATSEGQAGTAALIVVPPPVATVTVALSLTTVNVGGTSLATAVLRDAQGAALAGRTVTWTSSAPSVAQVSASGAITTFAPGTAIITATSEGQAGAATLTVQQIPVASVTISGPGTVVPGGQVTLSATLRDGNGAILNNRAIVWNSSNVNVAIVSVSGNVTGIAPGEVTISATSEGRVGTIQMSVRFAIATVTFSGSSRVKVGDTYTYTATARLADGTIIDRPVVWSVPQTTIATMTTGGVLTPLQVGTFTIRANIDGEVWSLDYTSYNWESFTNSGSQFVTLRADNQITNKYGTSEYPQLVISCSATGYFFVWVQFANFITSSGLVALSFDGGAPFSQTWNELSPDYDVLWKPGNNAVTKSLAVQIAAARQFGFAFTEYLGTAKAMIFRVGGLLPRLAPLFTSCPSDAIVASAEQSAAMMSGVRASAFAGDSRAVAAYLSDRAARAGDQTREPVQPTMAGLSGLRAPEVRAARRER
jgi:uncharacterized protein YjdB